CPPSQLVLLRVLRLFLRTYPCRLFLKKRFMQSRNRFLYFFFFNRKCEVDTRRSLRNQRHVDVADCAERSRRDSWCALQAFTHNTNYRSPFFHTNCSKLFKIRDDSWKRTRV